MTICKVIVRLKLINNLSLTMINIDHTCIKAKSKGIYKNAKSDSLAKEKPVETPSPIVYPEIDTPDPDFDYDTDYGLCSESVFVANVRSVDSEISNDKDSSYFNNSVDSEIDRVDFHLLRNNLFEHDNKDYTILESTYYQDLDILIVFGVPPFGDLKDNYCIWLYKDYCTDLKFVGRKEALYQRYKKYCLEVRVDDSLKNTGFVIPSTNPYIREWIDRLEPDGRYFPKKQLSLFGEV